MAEINDRIAAVLKHSGLTQKKFAERLNVSRSFIAVLCTSDRRPSDRTIRDICRVYGVSELWLREGQGETFVPRTLRQEILDLARSLSEAPPGDLRRDFLLALADLPPEFWPKLADFMEEILARRADDPGK